MSAKIIEFPSPPEMKVLNEVKQSINDNAFSLIRHFNTTFPMLKTNEEFSVFISNYYETCKQLISTYDNIIIAKENQNESSD